MEVILKANELLNGNHHLLNIIFSYLGQSQSAKVLKELTNDEDMNAEINGRLDFTNLSPLYPSIYFTMRRWSNRVYNVRKYDVLNIPRFKVDCLQIEDDVDCERCNKLLTYPERENYEGYCEYCYGKVYKMLDGLDEVDRAYKMCCIREDGGSEPDTEPDDEWWSETDED